MDAIVFFLSMIGVAALFLWTINVVAAWSARRKSSRYRYGSRYGYRDSSADSSTSFWSFGDSGSSSGDSCGGDGGGGCD